MLGLKLIGPKISTLKLRLEEIDNIQNQATEMQIKSEKTKEMGGVYKFYGFASFVKLIKTRRKGYPFTSFLILISLT